MYYSKQHKLDMEKGLKAEMDLYEPIKQLLDCDDLETTHSSCRYDYFSNKKNTLVELKSRNCYKNQYPTTLMPQSKWNYLKKKYDKGISILYVFNFKDKNCYYYYNGNDFTNRIVCRRDRGKIEKAPHIEIPISDLKDF